MLKIVKDKARRAGEYIKDKATEIAVIGAAAGASVASAGGSSPPTMPDIDLPVDISSVASKIALVGGTMLLAWGGIHIGFRLARKFITRAGGTV